MDLDAPGNINGVPVLEAELESFEEKPWRKPGQCLCVAGTKTPLKMYNCSFTHLQYFRSFVCVCLGADLSDYFNYGFNEDTWKAYCEKQKRLRMGLEVSNVSSVASKITVRDQCLLCPCLFSANSVFYINFIQKPLPLTS